MRFVEFFSLRAEQCGMRIAYLVNQYPKTSHTFIRREIRALESQGFTIERISLRPCDAGLVDPSDREETGRTFAVLGRGIGPLLAALLSTSVQCPLRFWSALRLALRMGGRIPGGRLRHLAYLAEACVLRGRYRDESIQHVHAHFGTNSAAVALLWNALGGPPYSFTVHGPEEFDKPEALSLGLKIARAKFAVGVSEFGRSQLMRWCPADQWSKLHVVHCAISEAYLEQTPQPVPAVRRLVCVGRLCEQKGHLLLVEAARRLRSMGNEFELVLVGDGPLRGEIEDVIRSENLGRTVRITGWQSSDQVTGAIFASRGMVLPSFAEGLPVVLMESLALGRPVISTYVAGIPELVQTGENGWLVPAGDVEALCSAMECLLSAPPEQLTEMGSCGAKRVLERHHPDNEAAKLATLFRSDGSGGLHV